VSDQSLAAPVRPRTSRRVRTAIVALSALAVLLAAASVGLAVTVKAHLDDRDALDTARNAAVAAARQEIVNLDSLSWKTVDEDLKRVLDGATGTFKDQFSRAQQDLKPVVVQRKSESTGQVLFAGVVRADTDTATVLVAVDRTVKDSTDPTGAVAHDRWRVDLEKHGGRWLVSDLQPVG
jgi:Mce-associated membrane protein